MNELLPIERVFVFGTNTTKIAAKSLEGNLNYIMAQMNYWRAVLAYERDYISLAEILNAMTFKLDLPTYLDAASNGFKKGDTVYAILEPNDQDFSVTITFHVRNLMEEE